MFFVNCSRSEKKALLEQENLDLKGPGKKSAVAVLTFFALCNANVSFLNLEFFRAACNFSIFLNLLLNTEDSFPFILLEQKLAFHPKFSRRDSLLLCLENCEKKVFSSIDKKNFDKSPPAQNYATLFFQSIKCSDLGLQVFLGHVKYGTS